MAGQGAGGADGRGGGRGRDGEENGEGRVKGRGGKGRRKGRGGEERLGVGGGGKWDGRGGGGDSFVACLSHLTIDHASLSRRSTVPTPNRDTFNVWRT